MDQNKSTFSIRAGTIIMSILFIFNFYGDFSYAQNVENYDADQEYEYVEAMWDEFINSVDGDNSVPGAISEDYEYYYYNPSPVDNNLNSINLYTATSGLPISTSSVMISTSTMPYSTSSVNKNKIGGNSVIKTKVKATTTLKTSKPYIFSINSRSTQKDIINLQKFLVSKGFLKMPKNTKYGKFGPLTKKALAKYKSSVNY